MHPYLLPVFLLTVAMSSSLFASGAESTMVSPVSADAVVWIKSPQDGQRVSSPVTLSFGNSNVAISPAGTERANSGHHHLLINLQELPAMDMPLPASAQVIHFGKGQTETTLELEPGVHSLQLLLGNHLHVPHARPVMSEKITITVE
ncbi:MAG: DUF4399 domain-containing protein [Porticoccaceae bacterium]|jgi:hypothetical protein|nr:DUF4399 domain-containing protein [Porticoccaceae bacterium]MDG1199245.1 DUF4399 domain-containing protein [Porticoccaceae bacterium]MDG1446086.1 DUF4399 domain-containing protein [Porticoccaceae bacterium]